MNRWFRLMLRFVGVALIVQVCGGVACDHTEDDIQYAPGYGYVVKITTFDDILSPATFRHYYAIFPTLEEAEKFRNRSRNDPDWFNVGYRSLPPEQRAKDTSEKYKLITDLLRPVPPPLNEWPLATPELPQPIPATPQ